MAAPQVQLQSKSDQNAAVLQFHLWRNLPQRPRWRNDSVTRLGSGEASTQITNKRSGQQQSFATKYFAEGEELDQSLFLDRILELPRLGRFKFFGFNPIDVTDNLIFTDVQYNSFRGKYLWDGTCYDYRFDITLSYITDERD